MFIDYLRYILSTVHTPQTVERRHPVVGTEGEGRGGGGGGGGGGRGGFNPALKDEDEKKEYFDSPKVLEQKVKQAVDWIRSSHHVIFFTGAGVSTR